MTSREYHQSVLERRLKFLLARVADSPSTTSSWDLREAQALQFSLAVIAHLSEGAPELLDEAVRPRNTSG